MAANIWSSAGSTDGNVAGNWSLGWVPKAGDDATFNATSVVNCVFSALITCDNFYARSAYTGTLDFNGQAITVTDMVLEVGVTIVDAADAMNGAALAVLLSFSAIGQRFLASAGWTIHAVTSSNAHNCVFEQCDSSSGEDTIARYSVDGGNNTSVVFVSSVPAARTGIMIGV